MKHLKAIIIGIVFLLISGLAYQIHTIETERRQIKEDLIELSKIKYGLFNVDKWKEIIAGIISQKIEDLDLEQANYEQMREDISAFLYKLIDGLEERYYAQRPRTFKGVLQGGVAALTDVFGQMREDVPTFTDEIVDFLENPQSREVIQSFLEKQLADYIDKTFAERDYSMRNRIIKRYRQENVEATAAWLESREDALKDKQQPFAISLFVCILILASLLLTFKKFTLAEYALLTVSCFALLIIGLLLPMIEIDARILEMHFTLLGEPVKFTDQVLYFKSKSILEIVELMLKQGEADIVLVGILVLLFSVIFPVSKLTASLFYLYNNSARRNGFINFLVFKTGKWSMADVMVVAIFMSYIGFSSIISEQLRQIEGIAGKLDVVTTNESSLEIGFLLFTSFVILSLLLAQRMQYGIGKD